MPVKRISVATLAVIILGQSEPAATSTLTDPTRPSYPSIHGSQQLPGTVASDWILNSTLVSDERRVAVINGTHVTEGESIGNATVVRIRKLDVDIQIPGKRITLTLLPEIVKRHR